MTYATGPSPAPELRPLTTEEDAAWRAFARAIVVLPRVLEAELLEAHGLTLSEYTVLMNLSEHPERSMRMNELADSAALSVSGLTRVIERLARQSLVERVKCGSDGRGSYAVLTDAGFARLEAAYPRHLQGVRTHVMDHLADVDLVAFADAIGKIAADQPGPPLRRNRAAIR